MEIAPDFIDWPGKGRVYRQPLRGMSDYARGAGDSYSANYVAKDGATLILRRGKWKARYKGKCTRGGYNTMQEAITALEGK